MVNRLHQVLHGFTVGAVIVAVLVPGLAAQTPRYEFDVASIKKRTEPVRLGTRAVIQGGRFSMPSVTVAGLVQYAWGIRDFQIVDGPAWMRTDRFEVEARALGDTPSREEVRLMVRSMLEDRFGLAVRWAQRELPHYALVVVRPDGQLGPYLRRDDCKNPETRISRPNVYQDFGGGSDLSGCGPLSQFVAGVSGLLDLPVVDATGLDGTFDYFLFVPFAPHVSAMTPEEYQRFLNSGGNIFTRPHSLVAGAIEKEFGLTLRATRGSVEVLVIDALDQPTEN